MSGLAGLESGVSPYEFEASVRPYGFAGWGSGLAGLESGVRPCGLRLGSDPAV
jgi:hypothetical protein